MAKTVDDVVTMLSRGIGASSVKDKLLAFAEFARWYDPSDSIYDSLTPEVLAQPRNHVVNVIGNEFLNHIKHKLRNEQGYAEKLLSYDASLDLEQDFRTFLEQTSNGFRSYDNLIDAFNNQAGECNGKTEDSSRRIPLIAFDDLTEGVAIAARRYLREKVMEGITVDEIASPITGRTIELGAALVAEFSEDGFNDVAINDSLTAVVDYFSSQIPTERINFVQQNGVINYKAVRELTKFSDAADNLKICKDQLSLRRFSLDECLKQRIDSLQEQYLRLYIGLKTNINFMLGNITQKITADLFDNHEKVRPLVARLEEHIDQLETKDGRRGIFIKEEVEGYNKVVTCAKQVLDGKTVTREYETIAGKYTITTNKPLDKASVDQILFDIEFKRMIDTKEKPNITFVNTEQEIIGIVRKVEDREYSIDREGLEEFTERIGNSFVFGGNITMPCYFPEEAIPLETEFGGFQGVEQKPAQVKTNSETAQPYTVEQAVNAVFGGSSTSKKQLKQRSKRSIGAYVAGCLVTGVIGAVIAHNHYAAERLDTAEAALCSPQGTLEAVELGKGMEPDRYQTYFKDGVLYVQFEKKAETNYRGGGTIQVSKAGWQFFGHQRDLSNVLDDPSCRTNVNKKLLAAQAVYRGQVK